MGVDEAMGVIGMGSACVSLEVISTSSTALINCDSVLIISAFSMFVPCSIVTSAVCVCLLVVH